LSRSLTFEEKNQALSAQSKSAAQAAMAVGNDKEEGGEQGVSESMDLRFVFKVVESLSLILALQHDGREGACV